MDAPETPSVVGEPSRPSQDESSTGRATGPQPPHLGALYASPGAPCVLVYYPEHHNLGMPLVPKQFMPMVDFLLPWRYTFSFWRTDGQTLGVEVRLALTSPLGTGWLTKRVGPVHVSLRIES
jgi:hypothetical protein